jgi:hypothetical protein
MLKFDDLWCYEAVRLREQQPPALEDRDANDQALKASDDITSRLMARARLLSVSSGLARACHDAKTLMRVITLIACLTGFVGGVSAALASLGDSAQPVNVIWALISLLLLPTALLFVWLVACVVSSDTGGWFGRLWQLAMARLSRSGSSALTWQAWLAVAERARSERWWLGLLTHTIWFSVLLGMVLGLITAFSLRHYTFVWQTTWLSDGVFVQLAQAIGSLPSKLGLTMPTTDIIEASGHVAIDEPSARLAWANWLVGAVIVFGLLPRLLGVVVSALMLHRHHRQVHIKADDAYAIAVRHKLERLACKSDVDGPPGANDTWPQMSGIAPDDARSDAAVVALETRLGEDLHGQIGLDAKVAPAVDDRRSRQHAEQRLSEWRPQRLLIVVDARQTPDRGLIRTILTLGKLAVQTKVFLLHADHSRARIDSWRQRLDAIGLTCNDPHDLLSWLRKDRT